MVQTNPGLTVRGAKDITNRTTRSRLRSPGRLVENSDHLALQRLTNHTRLRISGYHFPPGTTRWNKIKHRKFSHISRNWLGKHLISHEVIVNLIAGTTTGTGLKIEAELDTNTNRNVAAFLCSDLASGVTGENDYVDARYNITGFDSLS